MTGATRMTGRCPTWYVCKISRSRIYNLYCTPIPFICRICSIIHPTCCAHICGVGDMWCFLFAYTPCRAQTIGQTLLCLWVGVNVRRVYYDGSIENIWWASRRRRACTHTPIASRYICSSIMSSSIKPKIHCPFSGSLYIFLGTIF